MSLLRTTFALAVAAGAVAFSFDVPAQGLNAGQCIIAGRLNDRQKWAPRFSDVELLAGRGRVITSPDTAALADAQQVRVTKPALLTRCNGDDRLARGDGDPVIPKEPVPAAAPGIYEVDSVSFSRLRRGGELVEVKIKLPVEKVMMVTR